ncbi:MAG TPA: SCO family protein [Candidatus Baltobacteraceae bacterium]|nr:SCO family protein [Candidatus Baltobacteraceae bacterium]
MMRWMVALLGVALACLVPTGAGAHSVANEPLSKNGEFLKQVGLDQKLGAALPLDLPFRDESGKTVTLGSLFGGTPVILAFTYYNCTMLCPLLLDGIVQALRPTGVTPGKQVNVVVVSIDPKEGPVLAATKKEVYVQRYGKADTEAGWHFLTGQESAIQQLTAAAGFRYVYDAARKDFAHATGILILTPQGKISRVMSGTEFASRDLRLALVEASNGTIGTPIDQVVLYCYHYDPLTGKYGMVIMNVLRLAGSATVLCIGAFMLVMFRRDRRARDREKS